MDGPTIDAHEPAEPPQESIEALLLDAKRRRTRMIIGGASLLLLLAGGITAVTLSQQREQNTRIATAWGSLSRCLLGAPLEPHEIPSLRFRRLQLTSMTLSDQQRASEGGASWPDRCSTFAFTLDEALRAAGRDDDLAHASADLGKQLKDPKSFMDDLSKSIDTTWSLADLQKLPAASAVTIAGPPARAEAFDADTLGRATPLSAKAFSFKAIYTEPHPALDLRFLIDDTDAPDARLLCTARRAAPEANCVPLPKSIVASKQGLRLLATADDGAAPLVFAGNRGSEGIFRADSGELVEGLYSYGGYASKDGFSAVLGWKEQEHELIATRKPPGTAKDQVPLKPPFRTGNPYYSAQMLWDHAILRGVNAANERRLFALAFSRTGAALGEPLDIGELPEPGLIQGGADEPPHITGCKTAEAMVVRVKGYDNDFMTFRLDGRWTKPVSPEITGGTLSCSKSSAAIIRVEPAGTDNTWKTNIRQVLCTSAGCRTDVVRMEQLLHQRFEFGPKDNHVDAVALDGKMLVVWQAGDRGGVRMRLAPASEIANAPDLVIFDDMLKDGHPQPLSTLFDLKLLSREGFAVLLLGTVTGVHALRIEPDGKIAPMKISRG